MKPSQWAIAAVLLAVMVFGITFVMYYLGGPPTHSSDKNIGVITDDAGPPRELTFLGAIAVPPSLEQASSPPIDDEVRGENRRDFWFVNASTHPVEVGIKKLGCKCSGVEVRTLSPESRALERSVASLVGSSSGGLVSGLGSYLLTLEGIGATAGDKPGEKDWAELLGATDSFSVRPGAIGWIRLRWKGERVGDQTLEAIMWMTKESKKETGLAVRVRHNDPIRAIRQVNLGIMTEEQLTKGVTHHLHVWSSTRTSFELKAEMVSPLQYDPFAVGTPIPLGQQELRELERENNSGPQESVSKGPVLSGYKIPIAVRASDKASCDIGIVRRTVRITSRDVDVEPILIILGGRVRGIVELGLDDESGNIDFGVFPRRRGAKAKLQLHSSVKEITLEIDEQRTAPYLTATLKGPVPAGESRQGWTLEAQVQKEKVSGSFPRTGDPLFDDCAIYLIAKIKGQPDRPIRIAVRGMANES